MKRNVSAGALALLLTITLSACGSGESLMDNPEIQRALSGGQNVWTDSDIQGYITADTAVREQDDFAAAVNKEWKLQVGDEYRSALQDVEEIVFQKEKKAVTDESIQGEEAEVLRKYYALSSDWDYRNSQKGEPLRPYLEDIESISSMDELYAFCSDLGRNPLALAPVSVEVATWYHTEEISDINLMVVTDPSLSMTDEYGLTHYGDLSSINGLEVYESVEGRVLYMLKKMGYSEKEAKKILKSCLVWEKKVSEASQDMGQLDLGTYAVDREKAYEMTGTFPLKEILEGWGFGDVSTIVIGDLYAKKLPGLCKKGNLEGIKDYLIVNYCLKSSTLLDRETYDNMLILSDPKGEEKEDVGKSAEQIEDELQFKYYLGATPIVGALNKVYVENYFDETVTKDLMGLTEDIIDEFKVLFQEEEWLSEEGKKLCIEKLENISIHVAYQNYEVLDYSKTPFASKEEGGSFLEAFFAMQRYGMYHKVLLTRQKFDRNFWDPVDPQFSTIITNACYVAPTNGIYIFAGVCEPNSYSPDMTYEEKLAGLCTVVGHEITHGFDKNGSLYDKDGLKKTWLPNADQYSFNDRNDKVSAYYSTLMPYPGSGLYDGSKLSGEATADMGGIKVALSLASKAEGFDYDLFFRSYARLWRVNVPLEAEKELFKYDVHPLAFYRINVGLSQFDEFYKTYDIKEGDGMYVAPEKRIKVW